MTLFLTWLFGRLPIGWLQLTHNRFRLLAAVAGVAFATILIFIQLGFYGALTESVRLPYKYMDADILIHSPEQDELGGSWTIPRQRMFQALAVDGVAEATAVYTGTLNWQRADGSTTKLMAFGINPDRTTLDMPEINQQRESLKLFNTALLDYGTRNVPAETLATIQSGKHFTFEYLNQTVTVNGGFAIGGGFTADGYMVVSDQTFMNLFPARSAGAPNYIFIKISPNANVVQVRQRLRQALPNIDAEVETTTRVGENDIDYQTTQKPVGLIFGFGVILGLLVGITIVYQVLSTDVADHLSEYATFKAIGYPQRFFLGIVFEEATILAVLGFFPGLLIAMGIYHGIAAAATLPIGMTLARAIWVFCGTLAMCTLSGAIATRRLVAADPADLF